MFTFLSPVALWIGLFALIPIVIHFLGRGKLKQADFPSLLLIQKQLVESSKRHRIKNLLLLFLRILFILSLAAALFHPIMSIQGGFKGAEIHSLLTIHNGAWSQIKLGNQTFLERQWDVFRSLDSLNHNQPTVVYTIPPFNSSSTDKNSVAVHERFGGYAEAARQVEEILSEFPEKYTHSFTPIFNWSEFSAAADRWGTLAASYPVTQFHLIDYSKTIPFFQFEDVQFTPVEQKPALDLKVTLSLPSQAILKNSNDNQTYRLKLTFGENVIGEQPFDASIGESGIFSFQIPIQQEKDIQGHLSVESQSNLTPLARYYFNLKNPGVLHILHCGSQTVTLPSLGQGNSQRKIIHLRSLENDSLLKSLNDFQVIVLANASTAAIQSDKTYRALLEFTRAGGVLICVLGDQSDISKLNRSLFIPAKVGQVEALPPQKEQLGIQLGTPLDIPQIETLFKSTSSAKVRKHFPLKVKDHVTTLLQLKKEPLLTRTAFGEGVIYVWTVDLDNISWTTLGTTRFLPILHQHILQSHSGDWINHSHLSDSAFTLEKKGLEQERPVVVGLHQSSPPIAEKYGVYQIGPFSEIGNAQVVFKRDTTPLSVNLNRLSRESDPKAIKEWEKFLKITSPQSLSELKESFYPLWKLCILLGVFLFLIELLLLKFFSPIENKK